MFKHSKLLGITLLGASFASACATDDGGPPLVERTTGAGARVLRADGGALTAPSTAAPTTIATGYVGRRAGLAADQLAVGAVVEGKGGVRHVRLGQVIDGLRVHGAYARVAVSPAGEVLQVIDALAVATAVRPTALEARDALRATFDRLGYADPVGAGRRAGRTTAFAAGGTFHRDPTVEEVAYVAADGQLAAGFLVETWTVAGNLLDHTLIGADGAVLDVEHRTASDRYSVFTEDPLKGPQTVVNGPGAGNAQSPSGWLGTGSQTTWNITGNNTRTYLDTDGNNAADTGGTAVANGDFLTAADLGVAPSTASNKAVAVQNLFYLNNVAHDTLYRHGFNEAAGNFQVSNFGLGGAGNDPVLAEAQDGSGTDNANFATPADGSSPRMQMFLWTGKAPNAFVTVSAVDYAAYMSTFGTALTTTGLTGPLAIYNDGTGVASDGCELSVGTMTGKVAIIDRGTCNFTVKVLNAQKAGAIGAIIVNNVAGAPFAPGGTDRKIKIGSVMVGQADGATLKGLAGASARLRKSPVTPLQIDGDLDADIVFHEYGHGLSWRMIGGMSGKLAGAIGEGASDVNAFLVDGDDRIGEYAWSDAAGLRRYPYQGYPLTYSAVDGAEVHNDGEIYAGAMWRVLQNYLAAGLTADDLHGDFVDGMNFTPSSPAFEDMRDGMLQSVAGTGRECLIWRGFAASGIGVGADGRINASGTVTIVESFALPTACQ